MTFPTSDMDTIAREFDGLMGFFFEDITTGETHEYAASHRYPTASVCKITVMAELFRQDAEGILSLDDRKRMEAHIPHINPSGRAVISNITT